DSVDYIVSRIWAGEDGRDSVGAVVIQDEQIFTSRDVQKADARPGGYVATGGHRGLLGSMGPPRPPVPTLPPRERPTHPPSVRRSELPKTVEGTRRVGGQIGRVPVDIKDADGGLLPAAIPKVTIVKHGRYIPDDSSGDAAAEVDILARIDKNLLEAPLAGFVAEGSAPFGSLSNAMEAALRRATFSGMPVVKVGRGNAEGMVDPTRSPLAIAGSNLTATKARLLLMACLMKLGSVPAAADPANPTRAEMDAVKA